MENGEKACEQDQMYNGALRCGLVVLKHAHSNG